MADGDRTAIRLAARASLADIGTVLWSNDMYNRAIDEVTADISRLLPLEKYYEYTYRATITNEDFTSAAVGTAKALAYIPMKPRSEVVKNAGLTVTYARDTDYTMDYVNSTLTVISGGSMAGSTAYKVTYDRSPLALNISSLTDLVTPVRIEMSGSEPQEYKDFYRWGDLLYLGASTKSQVGHADKDHIVLYYHSRHTAPTDTVAGTYPRFLDQVVIKGTVAYALFIKARERALQAITDIASARTRLTSANTSGASSTTDLASAIATPLTDAATALALAVTTLALVGSAAETSVADSETALDTVDTTLLAKINTALDKTSTHSTGTTDSIKELLDLADLVWADETKHILTTAGIPNIEEFLELADNFPNTVNIGEQVTPNYALLAERARDMAMLWDSKRKDFIAGAQGWANVVAGFISEAQGRVNDAQTRVNLANGYMRQGELLAAQSATSVSIAQGRLAIAQRYVDTAAGHVATAQSYASQAAAYLQAADREMLDSDRFLNDARERFRDYWDLLLDRAQAGRRKSMSALRQYATNDLSQSSRA